MRRTVFNEDHEAFRETLRDFIEAEVVPVYPEWYDAGIVPREFYYKLAEPRPVRHRGARGVRRRGDQVLQVQRDRVRGDSPGPA